MRAIVLFSAPLPVGVAGATKDVDAYANLPLSRPHGRLVDCPRGLENHGSANEARCAVVGSRLRTMHETLAAYSAMLDPGERVVFRQSERSTDGPVRTSRP